MDIFSVEPKDFAEIRGGRAPIVRVTPDGGERFFLFGLEPGPGDASVTFYPHPARNAEMLRAAMARRSPRARSWSAETRSPRWGSCTERPAALGR